jgi:hypothetical protein
VSPAEAAPIAPAPHRDEPAGQRAPSRASTHPARPIEPQGGRVAQADDDDEVEGPAAIPDAGRVANEDTQAGRSGARRARLGIGPRVRAARAIGGESVDKVGVQAAEPASPTPPPTPRTAEGRAGKLGSDEF